MTMHIHKTDAKKLRNAIKNAYSEDLRKARKGMNTLEDMAERYGCTLGDLEKWHDTDCGRLEIDSRLPIGGQLKAARIAKGIPQKDFGISMGLKNGSSVAHMENGTGDYKNVGLSQLLKYAKDLGYHEIIIKI